MAHDQITREINTVDNIQSSVFNPIGDGGGPRWTRSEHYRSGIMVVPNDF